MSSLFARRWLAAFCPNGSDLLPALLESATSPPSGKPSGANVRGRRPLYSLCPKFPCWRLPACCQVGIQKCANWYCILGRVRVQMCTTVLTMLIRGPGVTYTQKLHPPPPRNAVWPYSSYDQRAASCDHLHPAQHCIRHPAQQGRAGVCICSHHDVHFEARLLSV